MMNGADSNSRDASLDSENKSAFSDRLEGIPWIEASSSEYDSKRKIYNLDNTSTPHAIACPRHAHDVANLVKYAIDTQVPITVRSGGHDIFGRAVVQSALCIDMRALDFVEIASDRKSARIGGGVLMGKLIEELSKEGLTTPFGSVPGVGYFGWASLGGYGALSGQCGLGVDQIIAAEVVDATGEIVRADKEMLKGIRGAGGNFGIVVGLQIKLYDVKTLLAGLIILDHSKNGVAETFAAFMTNFQSYQASDQLPQAATVQPVIVNHPEMGRTILITFVWSSPDHLHGQRVLEKVLEMAPVSMQTVTENSMTDWLKLLESFCPYGVFGGDKGISFRRLTPNVLTIIGRYLEKMPSNPATGFCVHSLSRSSPSATNPNLETGSCFNPEARQGHFILELIGSTVDQDSSPQSQAWIKDLYAELNGSGDAMDGSYVALADPEDMSLDKIYGTKSEDLLELKKRLDPNGVFKNAVPRISTA